MQITRTALVPFSANRMYKLVEDVLSYPRFLSWCVASKLIESNADSQVASLDISIAGMRQSFTTRNLLIPDRCIAMELLEGPFQRLAGEWRFEALGATGSKILLQLNFDFSGSFLSSAFRHGFASVADRLVNDFCQRAEAIYEN
ncbi:MAG: type II toxin-antitoxin system RatA family toxin [Xanthomonadales bacterium]|nr:type II toxin-antitoxin system RatA family toxin [Xanthomonadales bacterium]